jgi:hypothetical protein
MADKKISALPASTTPLSGTEVLPIVQSGATKQVSVANLTAGREVSASTLNVGGTNAPAGFGSKFLVEGGDASVANAFALKLWSSGNNDVNTIKTTGTRQLSVFNNDGADECLRIAYNRDVNVIAGNLVIGTSGKGIDFSADPSAPGMTSELLDDYEEGTWTPTLAFGGASTGIAYGAQLGTYTKIGNVVQARFTIVLSNKGSATGNATIEGLPFTVGGAAPCSATTILASNFAANAPQIGYAGNSTTSVLPTAFNAAGSVQNLDTDFANNTRLDMWVEYFV